MSHTFKFARIEDFTLPDSTRPIAPNCYFLVDSIGIFFHGFEGGVLRLQGAMINNKKFGTITSILPSKNVPLDEKVGTLHHYPNPFNSSTTIEYTLNNSGKVRIFIFNLLGQRIKILRDSFHTPGLYRVQWNGANEAGFIVASGVYLYVLEMNDLVIEKRKLTFLK